MGDETVKIEHLTKKFKDNIVLKDVSMVCQKGHIYGIVGYNGSGKSVFFKCISGLMCQDQGNIWILEQLKKPGTILENAGIIIEEPAFLKNKSGFDNLKLLYMIRNKVDKAYLSRVMEKVGLNPNSRKYVGKYSLGMKQRLAIAQAIMEDQEILILDEPMNGLDKKGVYDMRALFLELSAQGKTIIMASHNKYDIDTLCDEVYEIENGNLRRI